MVLHEVYDHGIGRLDCPTEDLVTDDDTIFNKNGPVGVDVSCVSMTPDTRGKQVCIYLNFNIFLCNLSMNSSISIRVCSFAAINIGININQRIIR